MIQLLWSKDGIIYPFKKRQALCWKRSTLFSHKQKNYSDLFLTNLFRDTKSNHECCNSRESGGGEKRGERERERERGGGERGKERGREREREKETDRHKTKKPEVRSKTANLQRRQTTLTLLGEYQSLIAVLPFSVFLKRFRQTMRMTHWGFLPGQKHQTPVGTSQARLCTA